MSYSRSGRSRPITPGRRALSTVLASLLRSATTWRSRRTGQDQAALGTATASSRRRIAPRFIVATLVTALVALSLPMGMQPASAASVSAASFSGDSKTLVVDGMLYAKKQAGLTLSVTTATAAKCVEVTGAHTAKQTSTSAKSTWSFSGSAFTAGDGNGIKTVTVAAYDNAGTPCTNGTGSHKTMEASYVLDNAGPAVTGSLSPAANAAGWNNSAVNITWEGNDAGVGFTRKCDGAGSGHNPKPCTDSVTAATNSTPKGSEGTDRLGNAGNGSVVVKIDTALPTITGSRSPAQPASGWNSTDVAVNFTCEDPKQGATKDNPGFASGIKTCGPNQTVTTDGANQSVTGKAVDVADNQTSGSVGSINIDKTAPVVTGAPTTSANGDGWYNGDVSIAWTCTEALSGLAGACPANSTIAGEGDNLGTRTDAVADKAGNSGSGSVSGIRIDRTAPNTNAVAPDNWNNTDVTVVFDARDALSEVKATYYRLNGGAQQTGTTVSISAEGTHTLEYWSVDKAGNVEMPKTVGIKIDKTKPSINHAQAPLANGNGWNNTNVTVTFTCTDGGSGIASCTAPQTVTTEGENQPLTGTAVDNAGNTATDPASVSIDKTAPTINASADRQANGNGWYKDDVTVSFSCDDTLSGIDLCPSAKILGQGANQSASGTATDAAGNSASAAKHGINVDKTAPVLTGVAGGALINGWYNADVNVAWTCSDALSDIDGSCPASSTVTGEGDNLGASASVSDKAGNNTSTTVGGIKIDRTAPTTGASVPAAKFGAWHAGSVQVSLTASDNLSGVDTTHYSVNGGAAELYTGPFTLDTTGTHTVSFWSVDKAGNVEDKALAGHTINVQIDNTNPSISGSRSPLGNVFGWNNGPVAVSFNCNDLESGLAGCTPTSETLTNEGAGNDGSGQSITGTAIDNVGNSESLTVGGIKIDATKPTLSGSPTTAANGAGWYRGDVSIKWTPEDGLSGIDPATAPGASLIIGEGANLGAGPVSVSDQAGNSTSASVSGIKIDRTAPTINGGPTSAANGAGWYKDPVTVAFSCTDNLSEVASCPSAQVLSTNGANQSVTSDKATDNAGNEAAGKAVGGINLDGTAPKTDADIVCTGKNGFCRGATATVKLTAGDQSGLSGVKGIHYKLNTANWTFASGATKEISVPLSGSGTATVLFYGEDNAGNLESQNGVSLKYDTIAPTVTHKLSPVANADDWNNSDVTVTFEANDDSDGSGVDSATVTKPVTVSTETAGQLVNGEALDMAGNKGTDSVTVKLDKTAPTITGVATTSPNGAGWYKGSVIIKFSCSDALSGIAANVCPSDVTLTANGEGQSVTRTVTDRAGNQASTTIGGINIDASAPTVTVTGVAPGGIYTLGSVPTGACTATDVGPSGLQGSCQFAVTGGQANGVGTFNYTATANDVAGNATTVTGTYTVRYPVVIYSTSFWLQPINDTAHTTGTTTSVFKAGSTVPVKFRLVDASGKAIQTNTAPQWITPAKGSATTSPVDESVYTEPATSGSNFTWNATEQLYQFNWASPKNGNGYFWRIGVRLDDGTTQAVNIGLR